MPRAVPVAPASRARWLLVSMYALVAVAFSGAVIPNVGIGAALAVPIGTAAVLGTAPSGGQPPEVARTLVPTATGRGLR